MFSLKDYFYRGAQRIDTEPHHMMQQKSPKAQFQNSPKQMACDGTQ